MERDRAEMAQKVAEQARLETETVSRSLSAILAMSDPECTSQGPLRTLELLERGVEQINENLEGQSLAKARFLQTIGEIYTKMGYFDLASEILSETVDLRRANLSSNHPDLLESRNQLGVILGRQRRFEDAERILLGVKKAREATGLSEELAMTVNNLGNVYWRHGRMDEAEQMHRKALQIRSDLEPPNPTRIGDSANNLGVLLEGEGRAREALPYFEQAVAAHEQAYGPEHSLTGASRNNLGMVLNRLGRWEEAEQHLRQTLDSWTRDYGSDHYRTSKAKHNLATSLRRQGRFEAAIELWEGIIRKQEEAETRDEAEIARALSALGSTLIDQGKLDRADESLSRAIALRTELLGPAHRSTLSSHTIKVRLIRLRGQEQKAWERANDLWPKVEEAYGRESLVAAALMHEMGVLMLERHQLEPATEYLREAMDVRRRLLPANHTDIAKTEKQLERLKQN